MIMVPFSLTGLDRMADSFCQQNNTRPGISHTLCDRPKDIFTRCLPISRVTLLKSWKGDGIASSFKGAAGNNHCRC